MMGRIWSWSLCLLARAESLVGCGDSVARARAANTSIIMLIQRSCIAVKGDYPKLTAPSSTVKHTAMFTVIWNWRNFLILS